MAAAIHQPSSSVPAFEMRDVSVPPLKGPAQPVLEGVNWTVAVGDFWAVGGLLRSGKSDLMALAAGVTQPMAGTYLLFGDELLGGFEHQRLELRLRIGLVFDGGQLIHDFSLAENIALPLRYHFNDEPGHLDQRLRALVDLTELEPWANSYPADVNRSWQQRIGLARALALKPQVLLLDNPLSGLDPRDAGWWLETLKALATGHPITDGKPLTLVVTADDLRPWQNYAGNFAVLKNRGFIPLGRRSELVGDPDLLLRDLLPGPVATA
jgi:ABC-type transporter Mla maintaining outer membrane lipid asymmetry ATPase subunit MlaF